MVVARPFRFGLQSKGPSDQAGWAAHARKVEDLGWSVLTVADHFDEGMAPFPALAAAAAATTTLRLGTMVLANDYRHPVVVAKEAATLDLLSGGRFELGIGAGWTTTDYAEAGIPLDRAGVRIAGSPRPSTSSVASGPTDRSTSRASTTGSPGSTGCPSPASRAARRSSSGVAGRSC